MQTKHKLTIFNRDGNEIQPDFVGDLSINVDASERFFKGKPSPTGIMVGSEVMEISKTPKPGYSKLVVTDPVARKSTTLYVKRNLGEGRKKKK